MSTLSAQSAEPSAYTYVHPARGRDAREVKGYEEAGLLDLPPDVIDDAHTLYDLCAAVKGAIETIAQRAEDLIARVDEELISRQAATGDDSNAFANAFLTVNPTGAAVEATYYLGQILGPVLEGDVLETLPPWPDCPSVIVSMEREVGA